MMHRPSKVSIAAVLALSIGAAAQAGEQPPGCTATALGISVQAMVDGEPTLSPVAPGEHIFYRVVLFGPVPSGCAFMGGQLSIDLPNGTHVPLAGYGGDTPDVPPIAFGDSFVIDTTDPYIVDCEDAEGDDFVVRVSYGSTVFAPSQDNGTYLTSPPQQTAAGTTVLPLPRCPGDTNCTGTTDVQDLVNVILDWGTDGSAHGGDVTGDSTTDVNDILEVVLAWGACG